MPFYTPTPKDEQEVRNWFTYHAPTFDQPERYTVLRTHAFELANIFLMCVPPSADRTAALRLLREAVMTANAAIACNEKETGSAGVSSADTALAFGGLSGVDSSQYTNAPPLSTPPPSSSPL